MKRYLPFILFACILLFSCDKEEEEKPRNNESIIPDTYLDRDNVDLGTINITDTKVTIKVWDHGQIDGDIVSIYVNGKVVIAEEVLKGPGSPIEVVADMEYLGYNYVLLYAHNEGSIPPNTCTMEIFDGVGNKSFVLESDLSTNGAVNVVVD
ncbi:hypothetical protein GCM10009119_10850 [Algoriphagus jejuensis]|uniref:Uncharacterized protein n=1 Tax=Algoriphagus jejuensis TaxID=419934 RepID=A0ABP3YEG3_9BACT